MPAKPARGGGPEAKIIEWNLSLTSGHSTTCWAKLFIQYYADTHYAGLMHFIPPQLKLQLGG